MHSASHFETGIRCRACATHIARDEPVLVHFHRCYYCGRFNPSGFNWRSIVIPGALIAAMTAFTAWWGQALL